MLLVVHVDKIILSYWQIVPSIGSWIVALTLTSLILKTSKKKIIVIETVTIQVTFIRSSSESIPNKFSSPSKILRQPLHPSSTSGLCLNCFILLIQIEGLIA